MIARRFALLSVVLIGVLSLTTHAACDTALLVIDVQEHFLSWGSWSTSAGEDLLDAVVRVLSLALPRRDRVFPKYSGDAFTTPEFAAYVDAQGFRRLLVCGLASAGCVSSTLFSAVDKGYEVTAVADAHSNGPPNSVTGAASWPAANVNDYWIRRGITVVPTAEIDWTPCATE